jgi:CMP-N-acetylneuraminic acid synthetase
MPLWMWSAGTAQRCRHHNDPIVVSTDDPTIMTQARALGYDVRERPEALCQDKTPTIDVVYDILELYETDLVCLLQPTSPDRRDRDVRRAIDLAITSKRSVVGVNESGDHSGAVYVYRRDAMPNADWAQAATIRADAFDIDTPEDWQAALEYQRLRGDLSCVIS